MTQKEPKVSIIMGSKSDYDTMKAAGEVLQKFMDEHFNQITLTKE